MSQSSKVKDDETPTARVVILQNKCDTLFEQINRIHNKSVLAQSNDECIEPFLDSVETVDEIRSEFRSIVDELNRVLIAERPLYKPNYQPLIAFDDLYSKIKRVQKSFNVKVTAPSSDTTQEQCLSNSLRGKMPSLPSIEIMSFDGDIRNWPLFFSSFKSMVHDNAYLTNNERLYYLLGKLSNEAKSVFSGITPSAENYDMILKCLVDRYEDSRMLANTYLDQMINLKLNGPASSSKFQVFMDKFVTAANALKNLKLNNLTDFILLHIALKKLDEDTIRAFELQHRDDKIPTFDQLTDFMSSQLRVYNNLHPLKYNSPALEYSRNNNINNNKTLNRPRKNIPNPHSYVTISAYKKCLCDNFVHDHLFKCPKFNELTPPARFKCAKERNACINCLSLKHKVSDCMSTSKCRSCSQRHHSSLHFTKENEKNTGSASPLIERARHSTDGAREPVSLHTFASLEATSELKPVSLSTTILLSTAQVFVYDFKNRPRVLRCLLDTGSQSNFITNECCLRLGLHSNKNTQLIVKGFGGSEKTTKGSADFKIFSRFSSNVSFDVSALIVDRITDSLPSQSVDKSALTHLNYLKLADETFANPTEVDMLLGANIFPHLLLPGKVHGDGLGMPLAIETVLGYIVMGNAPVLAPNCKPMSTAACCAVMQQQPSLDELVKKFWLLEDVFAPPAHSQDDLECENHFRVTTQRDASGRYVVALPFSDDVCKLGESFSTAHRRFLCLERKLVFSNTLRAAYDDIIREYVEKGYITELGLINDIDRTAESYYIPHHCVQREDKATTKIRMVLDASSKTSTGLSLNQVLHAGPNLQGDLNSILLNFRLFKIAISADVRQMFLQIGMREADRKYQRILFRFNPRDQLSIFEFNRVCFGMKSSVFHATRVVKQLIADEEHKFPSAAAIASNSTYMDDVCFSIMADDSSRNDESVAVAACTQLIQLFKCGQFDLVKWTSNSAAVLSAIPATHRAAIDLEIDRNGMQHKILGTYWDRLDDVFGFRVATPESGCTKRIILSVVARLWDNLGLVAPVILHAKLFIKFLHAAKCDWDDEPPRSIITLWSQFSKELPALNKIRVPRHLGVTQGCIVNLLGFADASERAYGAVVYLQVLAGDSRTVRLVCSKSKVAPMKPVSIPRLELCAVVLLSQLIRKVHDIFKPRCKVSNVFAFTDSRVVLCWISSPPHRWQTFVANRVVKVIDNVPPSCFHHIAGVENPADCLSRGVSPAELVNHQLWFSGPPWAIKDPAEWPITEFDRDVVGEMPELKSNPHTLTVTATESPLYVLANRMSSWSKLLRSVVYIYRFLNLLPRKACVSRSDLEFAENKIIFAIQRMYFAEDIHNLKNKLICSRSLQKLNPFLDIHGIIRVGGRLSNARIDYSQKHPCLLPRRDHVVDIIIDYFHKKYLHAGPELLMSLLRQDYWILAARRVIRYRIHKCNICYRTKPRPSFPMMADLPVYRVNQVDKPFSHTGCDYAGPIQYTPVRGRGVRSRKAWLCIFTCLTTRCLHIEIATELSTVNFLAALKRFLSRRGPIQCLYTDNATNFIGCRSYLRDLYKFLDDFRPHLEHELSESRIDCKQIPPASPHWGGCWESMVKVVKSHLFKVIGQQILSYEELLTVLTQIEALINSRPLTALSSDPAEPSALTPAHFLHTAPLYSLPAPLVESPDLRERHSLLDKLVQSFWQRWRIEYLHQLQARAKWNTPTTPIQIGSLVVIIVDNAPPLSWPLGVVEAVHPSKDGTTRVVTVRTSRGTFVRPVVRLCPLPNQ